MVRDVPGGDVGQCPHGDWIVAGDARARPRVSRKVVEESIVPSRTFLNSSTSCAHEMSLACATAAARS